MYNFYRRVTFLGRTETKHLQHGLQFYTDDPEQPTLTAIKETSHKPAVTDTCTS